MKMLSLTDQQIADVRAVLVKEMESELKNLGNTNKISLSYDLKNLFHMANAAIKKPIVYMTDKAYVQMRVLTTTYKHEVAAHGIATRKDNIFLIRELLVYPQRTNGSHVESDDELYPTWLNKLPDEIINTMRFQYHSHCNFSPSPSLTDENYYAKMADSVEDFYIFMIGCHREGEQNIWVYDKLQNTIFEPADITFRVGDVGVWMEKSRPLIKPMPVPAAAATVAPNIARGYYDEKLRRWVSLAEMQEMARDVDDESIADDDFNKRHPFAATLRQEILAKQDKRPASIDRRRKEYRNKKEANA